MRGTTQAQTDGLALELPCFAELNDLWRRMIAPFEETACLQVFEKGDADVAVCMRPEGGIGYNTVVIYTYDWTGKRYCPRAYWNTMVRGSNEVMGVHIAFNYQRGTIEARSPRGRFIFCADLSMLAPKQPEELFPGIAGSRYPSFHTLEGLRASIEKDGRLDVFEKDKVKVAVRTQSWGVVGWKGLILYTFDDLAKLWSPRVLWDSGTRDVRVTFKRQSGEIETRSGDGKLIFQANIAALKAITSYLD